MPAVSRGRVLHQFLAAWASGSAPAPSLFANGGFERFPSALTAHADIVLCAKALNELSSSYAQQYPTRHVAVLQLGCAVISGLAKRSKCDLARSLLCQILFGVPCVQQTTPPADDLIRSSHVGSDGAAQSTTLPLAPGVVFDVASLINLQQDSSAENSVPAPTAPREKTASSSNIVASGNETSVCKMTERDEVMAEHAVQSLSGLLSLGTSIACEHTAVDLALCRHVLRVLAPLVSSGWQCTLNDTRVASIVTTSFEFEQRRNPGQQLPMTSRGLPSASDTFDPSLSRHSKPTATAALTALRRSVAAVCIRWAKDVERLAPLAIAMEKAIDSPTSRSQSQPSTSKDVDQRDNEAMLQVAALNKTMMDLLCSTPIIGPLRRSRPCSNERLPSGDCNTLSLSCVFERSASSVGEKTEVPSVSTAPTSSAPASAMSAAALLGPVVSRLVSVAGTVAALRSVRRGKALSSAVLGTESSVTSWFNAELQKPFMSKIIDSSSDFAARWAKPFEDAVGGDGDVKDMVKHIEDLWSILLSTSAPGCVAVIDPKLRGLLCDQRKWLVSLSEWCINTTSLRGHERILELPPLLIQDVAVIACRQSDDAAGELAVTSAACLLSPHLQKSATINPPQGGNLVTAMLSRTARTMFPETVSALATLSCLQSLGDESTERLRAIIAQTHNTISFSDIVTPSSTALDDDRAESWSSAHRSASQVLLALRTDKQSGYLGLVEMLRKVETELRSCGLLVSAPWLLLSAAAAAVLLRHGHTAVAVSVLEPAARRLERALSADPTQQTAVPTPASANSVSFSSSANNVATERSRNESAVVMSAPCLPQAAVRVFTLLSVACGHIKDMYPARSYAVWGLAVTLLMPSRCLGPSVASSVLSAALRFDESAKQFRMSSVSVDDGGAALGCRDSHSSLDASSLLLNDIGYEPVDNILQRLVSNAAETASCCDIDKAVMSACLSNAPSGTSVEGDVDSAAVFSPSHRDAEPFRFSTTITLSDVPPLAVLPPQNNAAALAFAARRRGLQAPIGVDEALPPPTTATASWLPGDMAGVSITMTTDKKGVIIQRWDGGCDVSVLLQLAPKSSEPQEIIPTIVDSSSSDDDDDVDAEVREVPQQSPTSSGVDECGETSPSSQDQLDEYPLARATVNVKAVLEEAAAHTEATSAFLALGSFTADGPTPTTKKDDGREGRKVRKGTRDEKSQWWAMRQRLDDRMKSAVLEFEASVLGPVGHALLGPRSSTSDEDAARTLHEAAVLIVDRMVDVLNDIGGCLDRPMVAQQRSIDTSAFKRLSLCIASMTHHKHSITTLVELLLHGVAETEGLVLSSEFVVEAAPGLEEALLCCLLERCEDEHDHPFAATPTTQLVRPAPVMNVRKLLSSPDAFGPDAAVSDATRQRIRSVALTAAQIAVDFALKRPPRSSFAHHRGHPDGDVDIRGEEMNTTTSVTRDVRDVDDAPIEDHLASASWTAKPAASSLLDTAASTSRLMALRVPFAQDRSVRCETSPRPSQLWHRQRQHVMLCVDPALSHLPWEATAGLRHYTCTRVPSIEYVKAQLSDYSDRPNATTSAANTHDTNMNAGDTNERKKHVSGTMRHYCGGRYLVNTDGCMKRSVKRLAPVFKSLGWRGCGSAAELSDVIAASKQNSVGQCRSRNSLEASQHDVRDRSDGIAGKSNPAGQFGTDVHRSGAKTARYVSPLTPQFLCGDIFVYVGHNAGVEFVGRKDLRMIAAAAERQRPLRRVAKRSRAAEHMKSNVLSPAQIHGRRSGNHPRLSAPPSTAVKGRNAASSSPQRRLSTVMPRDGHQRDNDVIDCDASTARPSMTLLPKHEVLESSGRNSIVDVDNNDDDDEKPFDFGTPRRSRLSYRHASLRASGRLGAEMARVSQRLSTRLSLVVGSDAEGVASPGANTLRPTVSLPPLPTHQLHHDGLSGRLSSEFHSASRTAIQNTVLGDDTRTVPGNSKRPTLAIVCLMGCSSAVTVAPHDRHGPLCVCPLKPTSLSQPSSQPSRSGDHSEGATAELHRGGRQGKRKQPPLCRPPSSLDLSHFDDTGMPTRYLHAGSPGVVACLWDVTDGEVDKLSERALKVFYDAEERNAALLASTAPASAVCADCPLSPQGTKRKRPRSDVSISGGNFDDGSVHSRCFVNGGRGPRMEPNTSDLGPGKASSPLQGSLSPIPGMTVFDAFAMGRAACKFRFLTAASVVMYGVPGPAVCLAD